MSIHVSGGGGGGSGIAVATSKVQLAYTYAGADISSLSVGTATWTDLFANQSFTVDALASVIDIYANVSALMGVGAVSTRYASRFVIDSGGTPLNKPWGGGLADTNGQSVNPFQGGSAITLATMTLSAGTHTIKPQIYSSTAGAVMFLRPSAQPNTEFFIITVVERKQA